MESIKKLLDKAIRLPFYVVFFASWFMLFSYVHNRNDLTLNVLWGPLWLAVATALVILLLALAATRRIQAAGIIAGELVLIIFGYGYLSDFVKDHINVRLSGVRFLLLFLLILFAVTVYLALRARRSGKLAEITKSLNVLGLVLVLFNLVPLVLSDEPELTTSDSSPVKVHLKNPDKAPNVYYIVPEDYAGNDILKEQFKYDNSYFTDYLKDKGFSVFPNAIPNYPYSPPSLSSTLHMRYLDRESKKYGKTKSVTPYYQLMEDNLVVKTFKSMGYKYVHIGSWWGPTASSKLADKTFTAPTRYIVFNKDYTPNEFERTVFGNGIGSVLLKHPLSVGGLTAFKSESSSVNNRAQTFFNSIDYLKRSVKNTEGPTFTFMHIMSPHRPFVLKKDCSVISPEQIPSTLEFAKTRYAPLYDDQLACTNRQLEGMIDFILANSDRPPVIILQSDEGEYPYEYWEGKIGEKPYNWYKAPDELLRYKFETQSAFYLPGVSKDNVKDAQFVNTFRYVFNKYFDANLPLLPQKYYISNEDPTPFVFKDVTKRLQR